MATTTVLAELAGCFSKTSGALWRIVVSTVGKPSPQTRAIWSMWLARLMASGGGVLRSACHLGSETWPRRLNGAICRRHPEVHTSPLPMRFAPGGGGWSSATGSRYPAKQGPTAQGADWRKMVTQLRRCGAVPERVGVGGLARRHKRSQRRSLTSLRLSSRRFPTGSSSRRSLLQRQQLYAEVGIGIDQVLLKVHRYPKLSGSSEWQSIQHRPRG